MNSNIFGTKNISNNFFFLNIETLSSGFMGEMVSSGFGEELIVFIKNEEIAILTW